MTTLVLVIEYDGTDFSGWQIQPNARSVQEEIQKSYQKLTNEQISITGSGRTDAGVHAKSQVASIPISNKIIPEEKLRIALNSALPGDIRIINAKYLDFKFNARFDASDRTYEYYISKNINVFERNFITEMKYPIDEIKLFEISKLFFGINEFTTFSKINPDIKRNECKVFESKWEKQDSTSFKYTIRANHFLYGMVRALVGVMIDYARGKRTLEDIEYSLKAKNRELASGFAPPTGLFLSKVNYSDKINKIIFE